jgi:hypothetical protein
MDNIKHLEDAITKVLPNIWEDKFY